LLPMVLMANYEIQEERRGVENLLRQKRLSPDQKGFLISVGKKYKLTLKGENLTPKQGAKLLLRVDSIPVSMALGQAAYESGYASSRFAAEGNALFGQWKWGEGLVPKEQRAGKGDYRIATFPTPLESVKAYALNLNTHQAYEGFRKLRQSQRNSGKKSLSGKPLIQTLEAYSERGMTYVHTLNGMIEKNNLWVLDEAKLGTRQAAQVKFVYP